MDGEIVPGPLACGGEKAGLALHSGRQRKPGVILEHFGKAPGAPGGFEQPDRDLAVVDHPGRRDPLLDQPANESLHGMADDRNPLESGSEHRKQVLLPHLVQRDQQSLPGRPGQTQREKTGRAALLRFGENGVNRERALALLEEPLQIGGGPGFDHFGKRLRRRPRCQIAGVAPKVERFEKNTGGFHVRPLVCELGEVGDAAHVQPQPGEVARKESALAVLFEEGFTIRGRAPLSSARSSVASRSPSSPSNEAAVFGPIPGTPGMLSVVSPTRPR